MFDSRIFDATSIGSLRYSGALSRSPRVAEIHRLPMFMASDPFGGTYLVKEKLSQAQIADLENA